MAPKLVRFELNAAHKYKLSVVHCEVDLEEHAATDQCGFSFLKAPSRTKLRKVHIPTCIVDNPLLQ